MYDRRNTNILRNYNENGEIIGYGESIEIGAKYKGVSNSLAKVYAETYWNIMQSNCYFSPVLYNRSYPNGFIPFNDLNPHKTIPIGEGEEMILEKSNYWMTHKNSESTIDSRRVTDSDMLQLIFSGEKVCANSNSNIIGNFAFDN